MNYTLDTNIIIYLLDEKLAESLLNGKFYTSITDTICAQTIELRCRYRLKLSDAIIAATAIVQESIYLAVYH